MWKNIFKIIFIFIIGMVGGIFADQIFWPYFVERPLFYQYRLEKTPIYVTERKEVRIQENTALTESIEKVKDSIVGVQSKSKTGKILEGSGLILTSDGLVLTLADLVPQNYEIKIFFGGKESVPKVLQRKNNLALLKIEEKNLPTISFADFEEIKLGERVFLLGLIFENNLQKMLVNEGIVKSFDENLIQTNIIEEKNLQGSALFNIEGQLVGLNTIDKEGKVIAISIKAIRQFIGF